MSKRNITLNFCLTFFVIFTANIALAQEGTSKHSIISPDPKKIDGITYPTRLKPIPCGGSSNNISADLNWKPSLTIKNIEIEHDAPNQELIESIKAEKLLLKYQHEQTNIRDESKTTSVTPTVGVNFAGNTNNGNSPLDNTIAISNGGNIVSVINDKIEYYNASGTNLYSNTMTAFLPSSFGVTSVCDPVVLYDYGNDRFIFFCQQRPLVSGGIIYIAFSKTNDPMAGWWCYQLYGDPTTGNSDAFDYPKVSVNDSEVFIAGTLFYEPSGSVHQAVVFQLDKLAGYAGGILNGVNWTGITNSPFTLLPVSWGQSGDVTGGMLLVSTQNAGGSNINLYQIVGNWANSPVMNHWNVSTTPYTLQANALQSGTTCLINTGDCRALSGFVLNGLIHFTFNSDAGSGYTGINYNRLNISTLTNTSSIFHLANYDYAYGAVGSFATSPTDNSVMIGFGRTGSSIYPEIRVVNCDNAMSWSGSTIVKSGISNVSYTSTSVERWGDYTGMARKHNSTTPSVWMNGMYGNSSHTWDTWIAQINGTSSTGVNEVGNNIKSNIYPNPIRNQDFHVEFLLKEPTDLIISLIDVNGKIIKELFNGVGNSGSNVFSFNTSSLSNGEYILNIKSNSQNIKNEKVVVSN